MAGKIGIIFIIFAAFASEVHSQDDDSLAGSFLSGKRNFLKKFIQIRNFLFWIVGFSWKLIFCGKKKITRIFREIETEILERMGRHRFLYR